MHFIQIEFLWFTAIVIGAYWAATDVRLRQLLAGLGVVLSFGWGGSPLLQMASLVYAATTLALDERRLIQPLGLLGTLVALGGGAAHVVQQTPLLWSAAGGVLAWNMYMLHTRASEARVLQNLLLASASAVFYGFVHPWFLALLYFSAVLDFNVGKLMVDRPDRRQSWLLVSLAGNLGMLGVFKYYNFFVENVAAVFALGGVELNPWTLQVLLPVGISFYTFQTLSYTIDCYRGTLSPRRDFLDYVVYVSFFPQLVAGPIERASSLLPQVEKDRSFVGRLILSGFGLALWGGFKKVCIADTIAPYVDEVFMTREPTFAMVFAASWGFGVQMLADFSAYTDIARGCARMMGFELVRNFDRPYAAATTPEFWRRWHMSLSSWVGDYVYTPILKTGRPTALRMTVALFFTFFLIGLWHGASWNFIVLGLWSFVWVTFFTFVTPLAPRWVRQNRVLGFFGAFLHAVVVLQPCGLLFRERNLERVWQHLTQPMMGGTEEEWVAAGIVATFAAAGSVPMTMKHAYDDYVAPWLERSVWYLPAQTTFWSLEALMIFVFYRDASEDFIYFQF